MGCTCAEEISTCNFCREQMKRDDEIADLRQRVEALEPAVKALSTEPLVRRSEPGGSWSQSPAPAPEEPPIPMRPSCICGHSYGSHRSAVSLCCLSCGCRDYRESPAPAPEESERLARSFAAARAAEREECARIVREERAKWQSGEVSIAVGMFAGELLARLEPR